MFEKITDFVAHNIPHIFFISFDKKICEVLTLEEAKKQGIYLKYNPTYNQRPFLKVDLQPHFMSFNEYKAKFDLIQWHLHRGDTYLLNFTQKTPISLPFSIEMLAQKAYGKFIGYWPNRFLFFSPEPFVYIDKFDRIHTYPMKGTSISLNDPDGSKLLSKEKENREHATVVDLLRNDLAIVARNIEIIQYKYLEKIPLSDHTFLWQMSTHIQGELDPMWKNKAGDVLNAILPAGSISGAPKEKTIQIIEKIEGFDRNFYTGIAGIFNGIELLTCVMIRFIGVENDKLYYYSGGGITSLSQAEEEYTEYKNKIYATIAL
jgi:para-aminobenzoate synthetase component 1